MQGSRLLKTCLLAVALAAATVVASSVRAQGAGAAPGGRAPVLPAPALAPDGGHIGVSIRNVGPDDVKKLKLAGEAGVMIEAVQPDSPASAAGLRAGDLIVEFDGERVRSARQLTRLVLETPPGRHVRVGVMRDGRRSDLEVTPAPAPPGLALQSDAVRQALEGIGRFGRDLAQELGMPPGPGASLRRGRLGVSVQPLEADLAAYFGVKAGVLVSSVVVDSPASKAGVRAGDVITAVDGRSVTGVNDLVGALGDSGAAREITLTVVRDRKELTLKAKIEGVPAPAVRAPGRRGV
jgi:serine protease Do